MSAKELNVQSDSAVACDMQQANSACVTRYKGAASTHGHRSQQDKHANSVLYSVINLHDGKWAPYTSITCCVDTCLRATSLSAFALRLATSLHHTTTVKFQIHTPVSMCGKTQYGMHV